LVRLLEIEYPALWIGTRHHRNTNNQPLDFSDKPYLLPIYQDKAEEIIIVKCVQAGITEWLICDTLSFCDRGAAVFYVLPTQPLRNTFVPNRISKLRDLVPYYGKRLREIKQGSDSSQMKHFGKGTMKLVGSNSLSEFGEFPADVVTIDEYDLCDQDNIKYARDRNQAAKIKYYRSVGNPTIDNNGIDELFRTSDQKFWHIKCDHCEEWQPLDFFVNVVRQKNESTWELQDSTWKEDLDRDIGLYCKKCHQPIDRLKKGEFVSAHPQLKISGYQLSHLFVSTVQIRELWALFNQALGDETKKQVFYNRRLGLTYVSTGAKLTQALLDICVEDYFDLSTIEQSVMGVDVGTKLHLEIREKDRIIHIASHPNFSDLDDLMTQFNVAICVIDAMPETRKAKEFQAKHRGKVWLCRYSTQPNLEAIKRNEDDQSIEADRTQTLDGSHAEILQKKIGLPTNYRSLDNGDFLNQMCAPTRVWDEDRQRYKWVEPSGIPDHYRHAHNYAYIANQMLQSGKPFIRFG